MRTTGAAMSALRTATADLHVRADAELRSGGWLGEASSYACFTRRLLTFHRVVEGSTLGGQVLIQWVARDLGPSVAAAATHLAPYGEHTPASWTELGVVGRRLADDPESLERAVEATRATFALHHALVGDGTPMHAAARSCRTGGTHPMTAPRTHPHQRSGLVACSGH